MDEINNENLLKWAQATLDANRLKAEELKLHRRREAIPLQLMEAAATLSQDIRLLLPEIRNDREKRLYDLGIQERRLDDIDNRLDRLERLMGLLLTEYHGSHRQDAAAQLEAEASIRKQINRRSANLNKLNEQAAEHGEGDVPLNLLNKIEAEQIAIEQLRGQMDDRR